MTNALLLVVRHRVKSMPELYSELRLGYSLTDPVDYATIDQDFLAGKNPITDDVFSVYQHCFTYKALFHLVR